MGTWKIKRNDTVPPFSTTLTDASNDVVDLTGATVKFIMKSQANGEVKVASTVTTGPGGAALDTTGVYEYAWTGADTDTAAEFWAEHEVTYPSGKKQTFPTVSYDIIIIYGDLDDS